jgi:hypothetical protein
MNKQGPTWPLLSMRKNKQGSTDLWNMIAILDGDIEKPVFLHKSTINEMIKIA